MSKSDRCGFGAQYVAVGWGIMPLLSDLVRHRVVLVDLILQRLIISSLN